MWARIKYIVNSHAGYARASVPPLLADMAAAGIQPGNIVVVAGGGGDPDGLYEASPLNLFDWTALHWLASSPVRAEADYWFLLPDTSRVGPAFARLAEGFEGDPDGVRLTECTRCGSNIGAYSLALVERSRHRLEEFAEECRALPINEVKRRAILVEDALLAGPGVAHYGRRCDERDMGEETPYGGATRKRFYYPFLDLYRLKANFVSPDVPLIVTL